MSARAEADQLSPGGVSLHKQLAPSGGRSAIASDSVIASDSEVVADRAERPQEGLGVLRRFEATHDPFPLACRLV
jgi:hypothetical protein